jgi:hypothetical protein
VKFKYIEEAYIYDKTWKNASYSGFYEKSEVRMTQRTYGSLGWDSHWSEILVFGLPIH